MWHSYRRMLFLCGFLLVIAGCATVRPVEQTPPVGDVTRGAQLYNQYCIGCHGGATGGSMMDIPPPHNANGHTWHHPDCQLVAIVLNGTGEMGAMMRRMMGAPAGTPQMPAFKDTLSRADVEAILAYIKTWWTAEQREAQRRITEQRC